MSVNGHAKDTFVILAYTVAPFFYIFFQQRVESITLLVGRDEDSLKEVDQVGKH